MILSNPVGREASTYFGTHGKIVGVVKDFHFASLHSRIEPIVIECFPGSHQLRSALCVYLLIRLKEGDIKTSLQSVQNTIQKVTPGSLFTYSFLDQDLNQLYTSEKRISILFKYFAMFAIFISCLGLFGLSSYSTRLRVKEIGIRKTLGASLSSIIQLLSRNFIIWIVIANAIALPLGLIFVNNWLQNFAYKVNIGYLPFILTIIISTGLGLIAVSYHSFMAALRNPSDSLRYE